MSAYSIASGQRCLETEVRGSFCGFAVRVQETNVFAVHSFKNAFGNNYGHLVLKTVDNDALSYKIRNKEFAKC